MCIFPHHQIQMIKKGGTVEVEVEQEDLNYIATDLLGKNLDHWRVELPINARKTKGSMKGNYTIFSF